jgi:hypothetical protein
MMRNLLKGALAVVLLTAAALAQPPKPATPSAAKPAAPAQAPSATAADQAPDAANIAPDVHLAPDVGATTQPLTPQGPMVLLLRGLDKITGRSTDIVAPIGKPVSFATLTIIARTCYSTPQSETPQTAAFVQIDDHRPDQPQKRVFSGWMYASSPGLNGVDHPLYDVWAITCRTSAPGSAPLVSSTAPVKVAPPDSSDKQAPIPVPADVGQ